MSDVKTEVPKHQLSDHQKGDKISANGYDFVVDEVRDDTYLLRVVRGERD